jgi:hypothetical protein
LSNLSLNVAVIQLQELVDRQRKAIEALAARVSTLEQAPPPELKRGPGRPPKAVLDGTRV